jgi:uncharacterized protein
LEPYKLPKMSDSEIDKLVDSQIICRIALRGEDYPYLAPFRYIKYGDTLYFHFTDYGKKMRFLRMNRKACVQIEQYEPDLSNYRFVSFRGRLEEVIEEDEYQNVVKLFSESGSKHISTKFLAAHGIKSENGWSSFNASNKYTIMKLVEVTEKIGLKSP